MTIHGHSRTEVTIAHVGPGSMARRWRQRTFLFSLAFVTWGVHGHPVGQAAELVLRFQQVQPVPLPDDLGSDARELDFFYFDAQDDRTLDVVVGRNSPVVDQSYEVAPLGTSVELRFDVQPALPFVPADAKLRVTGNWHLGSNGENTAFGSVGDYVIIGTGTNSVFHAYYSSNCASHTDCQFQVELEDLTDYVDEASGSLVMPIDFWDGDTENQLGVFGTRAFTLSQFTLVYTLIGDITQDDVLDVADVNQLTQAIRTGQTLERFDLDGNGIVNQADRRYLIERILETSAGDANLDGEFNSGDLIDVFLAGQYEDGIAGNSRWETGDWDGNGEFDSGDFIVALATGRYEQGPAASVVPEPTTSAFWIGAFLLPFVRRVGRSRS